MKLVVLLAAIGVAQPAAGQTRSTASPRVPPAQPTAQASTQALRDQRAEAYEQYLLALRLQKCQPPLPRTCGHDDDVEGAISAYKRAIALDPSSGEVVAALADLYVEANRDDEALATAEQALKIDPESHEAHRILGTVYASKAMASTSNSRTFTATQRDNLNKAIQHLEAALDRPISEADAQDRATLAQLYITNGSYDKAIPILAELVKEEPQWQDGATLLVEAYAAAGRADEAIRWLEATVEDIPQLYPTLGDFYGRQRRWRQAATAYEHALQVVPRSVDLRIRYGSALLNEGGAENAGKARDALREALAIRSNDERALYLLSQAERLSGDPEAAETTARRLVRQNGRSPRAYVALAEALEERQRYQAVADAQAPAVAQFRSLQDAETPLSMLLPHLGFAYQQVGQVDKAIAVFEEARKLAPDDPAVTSYLIQAEIAGKKYGPAAELAHQARSTHPDDVRLARLEAQALRQGGKVDQGLTVLTELMQRHSDNPVVYIAVAQYYSDANRGAQAVKLLQDAQGKFPTDTSITFELGAVLDKQKRYAESESVFRQLLTREPDNAPALNYLGYMLAERGEHLGESVDFVKRALKIEPENGSYLDSLGWAYYKSGKIDLALDNLGRAAGQLTNNSVVQDHYGDVLAKAGRFNEAIAAWTRAISGDGDSVDRGNIEKKVKSARQKLPKK
jgi:tetratricopeptide (TPR) repeat protein